MSIHEKAAVGFTREVDAYDRGRPTYPREAIGFLIRELELEPGKAVLDLGAGTGKLTKMLLGSGAQVIAVEPLAAMRAKLEDELPEVDLYDGTAESIPLTNTSVDAVTVAQAFHWFDGPRALAEISRVLKPGGVLALIWNVRDESVAWVHALTELLEPLEGDTPRYTKQTWRTAFSSTKYFGPLEETSFEHSQPGGHAMMFDRITSISFIAALPPAERARFDEALRTLLTTHPDTRTHVDDLALPYQTRVYLARRL